MGVPKQDDLFFWTHFEMFLPHLFYLKKNEISLDLRSPKSKPIYVSMVDKKQTCHSLKNIDEMGVDNNKKYVHIYIPNHNDIMHIKNINSTHYNILYLPALSNTFVFLYAIDK